MTARRRYLFAIVLAALPLAFLTYAQRSNVEEEKEQFEAPTYLIESLEGRDMFRAYCAGCHGADARGGGPAAAALKSRPPDLTQIARRRGGVFSLAGVERIIAGEERGSGTHAAREMPVWGPILSQIQRDQDLGKIRIRNIAKYLESLQTDPGPAPRPDASK